MTVADLKQIMSKYPDDMEVFIDIGDDTKFENNSIWLSAVREPNSQCIPTNVLDMKIVQRPHNLTKDAKKCLIL